MNSPSKLITARFSQIDLAANELDHAVWSECESAQITSYWSGQMVAEGRQAEARIVWSNEALHLRFECRQSEPLIVNASPKTESKTLGLWDRDVCEFFAATELSSPHHYFEFEAAPTGEWVDLAIVFDTQTRHTDWDFHSGMSTAARIDDDRIIITMRIPWSGVFRRPVAGREWRVNLCRCVGAGADRGYLCWQPTLTEEPNFHVPDAFGTLRFAS